MSDLANRDKLPKRKIQLKPIHQDSPRNNSEEELTETGSKIDQMREELQELEEIKKAKLEELQSTIHKEKANWEEEKMKWIEEAKDDGFHAGFKNGEKESLKQYQASLDEVNQIVDLVKIDYQKTLEQTDDVIIDLAIHTAEKILSHRLTESPEDFIGIVKKALKEIKDQSVVSIYLHPKNYQAVLLQKAELKRIMENDTKLSLYMKDDLKEGSCIIEHPFGQIDASVDIQLSEIRNALRELIMEQD